MIGLTATQGVESIYLELAQRCAHSVSLAIAREGPDALQMMVLGAPFEGLGAVSVESDSRVSFARDVHEMNLSELKVYNLRSEVLFATHSDEIYLTTTIRFGLPEQKTIFWKYPKADLENQRSKP